MERNDVVKIWDDDANFLVNLGNAVAYLMEVDRLRLRNIHDREVAQGNLEEATKIERQLEGVREWLDKVYQQSRNAREQPQQPDRRQDQMRVGLSRG